MQAYLDPLASGGVDNGVPLANCAAVDAHVGQLTKPALLQLEGKRHQRPLDTTGWPVK